MDRRNALKSLSLGVGYSLTVPAIASLMTSCKQASTEAGWKPEHFTSSDYSTINELSDILLPKTDTPGAKEIGVGPFVDKMVGSILDQEEKEKFTLGLEVFNRLSGVEPGTASSREQLVSMLDKHVVGRSDEERSNTEKLLASEDIPSAGQDRDEYLLHYFLNKHKELSLMGYFGSEEIGKHHLSYLPIPGPYQGCIDLATVGKAWSLN